MAPSARPAPKYCDITGYEVIVKLDRPNIKTVSVDSTFLIKT